jgi:serine phosphatase RsbU (regulator of sigma subunit)
MAYGCAQQLHQDLASALRPEVLLYHLNHAIAGATRGKFTMSCFAAIIDMKENKLTFASGAHAFPLLLRARDQQKPFIPLVAAGSPLGSVVDAKFEANTQPFEPGDLLICYTDGLIEAANPNGDQFGDKRVRQTVQKNQGRNVEEICEALLGEVARFVVTDVLEDDQTLVVARHTGVAASQGGPTSV